MMKHPLPRCCSKDRASWLKYGTWRKIASDGLRIRFFDSKGLKLEKYVFGPQYLRRLRVDEQLQGLGVFLQNVWKLPPPSLVVRIFEGELTTVSKMRFREVIREMILSTPTIWILGAASSTPASQVVGQVLLDINREFNTVEDKRFNKPVVNIGIGVWHHVDEGDSLQVTFD